MPMSSSSFIFVNLCVSDFFKSVINSTSCLHHMLPLCRDNSRIAELRNAIANMQFRPYNLTDFESLFHVYVKGYRDMYRDICALDNY